MAIFIVFDEEKAKITLTYIEKILVPNGTYIEKIEFSHSSEIHCTYEKNKTLLKKCHLPIGQTCSVLPREEYAKTEAIIFQGQSPLVQTRSGP